MSGCASSSPRNRTPARFGRSARDTARADRQLSRMAPDVAGRIEDKIERHAETGEGDERP